MAELRWRSLVPTPGDLETDREFLNRLIRWLRDQERTADFDLEEFLAFGGAGMASRIQGFEGVITGYSPPSTHEILAAPTGARKKVVIGLRISIASAGDFNVVKAKGATDAAVYFLDGSSELNAQVIGDRAGYITLDATDETLEIQTISGSADISYEGSFIDVE